MDLVRGKERCRSVVGVLRSGTIRQYSTRRTRSTHTGHGVKSCLYHCTPTKLFWWTRLSDSMDLTPAPSAPTSDPRRPGTYSDSYGVSVHLHRVRRPNRRPPLSAGPSPTRLLLEPPEVPGPLRYSGPGPKEFLRYRRRSVVVSVSHRHGFHAYSVTLP